MTLFQIVALYVALNLVLACVLMLRVGNVRIKEKVNLGDGGNALLFSRIRAHANFTETTPLALIGLFALAGLSAPALMLHIFGGAFTLGRVLHAHGMAAEKSAGTGRTIGALLSLLSFLGIAGCAFYLIFTG